MKLVIFQRLIKLKLISIKNINKDLILLEKNIYQTMNQLHYIFSLNLINYHKYLEVFYNLLRFMFKI